MTPAAGYQAEGYIDAAATGERNRGARQKSAAQTDPERRRFLRNLTITNQPFEQAMKQVLGPVKFRYEVEDKKVVLYRQ